MLDNYDWKRNEVTHPYLGTKNARYLTTCDPSLGLNCGDRVEKIHGAIERGDFAEVGDLGTVIGSVVIPGYVFAIHGHIPEDNGCVFVEWDRTPGQITPTDVGAIKRVDGWFETPSRREINEDDGS